MKRTLVISDVHGCHKEFNELLQLAQYNPSEDRLILLGDYCDRGTKSKEVIEQVKTLVEEWNVIALRGNHDQMFLEAMLNDEDGLWLYNGGYQTVESYIGLDHFEEGFEWDQYVVAKEFIKKYYSHHLDFLQSLPYYHEDNNHIFAHAGINPFYDDNWKNQPIDDFIWIREIFINNKLNIDKTVVFGHTPTIYVQETEDVWFGERKIGVDGGCVFGMQMNCLEISDQGYKSYYVPKGGLNGS